MSSVFRDATDAGPAVISLASASDCPLRDVTSSSWAILGGQITIDSETTSHEKTGATGASGWRIAKVARLYGWSAGTDDITEMHSNARPRGQLGVAATDPFIEVRCWSDPPAQVNPVSGVVPFMPNFVVGTPSVFRSAMNRLACGSLL
jgi:hypothetical protein